MTYYKEGVKVVRDHRLPKLIKHSEICYPPPHPDFIDEVDVTYPGIVVEYPNGYQIEDGVHRIAKLQREGIYESLFYVVSRLEYKNGIVGMRYNDEWITLGLWNVGTLTPRTHNK